MNSFHLDIITPARRAFSEEVERVSIPTSNGQIEVLAHHTAIFTSLSEGEVKISTGTKQYFLAVGGGFMDVTRKGATILVSRAVHAHELNEAEIKKARESAADVLKRKEKGAELSNAQAILRRSLLELKVFRRRTAPVRA